MSKATLSARALPPRCRSILEDAGRGISIARRRRRIPLRDMAARMSVSLSTVQRLERGDPSVSLGIFLSALWALQLHEHMAGLLDPGADSVGTALSVDRLPGKIRRRKDEDLDF